MNALRYMCQYLAEPKKGGGILMVADEEQPHNAPFQMEQPLYITDLRYLFADDDPVSW